MSTLKVNGIQNLAGEERFGSTLVGAKAATGTVVDFTGIPSWVNRITVAILALSGSGTSPFMIQVGKSSGILNSGYIGVGSGIAGTVGTISSGTISSTAGFPIGNANAAASSHSGQVILSKFDANWWVASGGCAYGTGQTNLTHGTVQTNGMIDRIRITTVNGTDTFDGGYINIMYE